MNKLGVITHYCPPLLMISTNWQFFLLQTTLVRLLLLPKKCCAAPRFKWPASTAAAVVWSNAVMLCGRVSRRQVG